MLFKFSNLKKKLYWSLFFIIIFSVFLLSLSGDSNIQDSSLVAVMADGVTSGKAESYDDSILSVIQVTPEGVLKTTERKKEIYVVFNHPLVPLAALDDETKGVFSISPKVQGKFRWHGSRICSFIPDQAWSSDMEYTVNIPAGLKSINGEKLPKDYKFKFRIETGELGVNCYPSKYNTINYDQSFYLRFDFPVKKTDLLKYLTVKSGNKNIPYTLTASSQTYSYYSNEENSDNNNLESSRNIRVKPLTIFDRGTKVVLDIKEGLKSENAEAGILYTKNFEYMTHGPLKVTFQENGDYYQDMWRSGLEFSNYVDMKKAVAAIKFTPHVELRNNPAGNRKKIGLDEWNIKAGATYNISVAPMSDIYGNRWNKSLQLSFTVPDFYPDYYIQSYMNLLEAEAGKKVPVEIYNIQEFDLGIGKYSIKDIQAKLEGGYKYKLEENLSYFNSRWIPGVAYNQAGRFGYDASKHLEKGKYGWLALRFTADAYDPYKKSMVKKTNFQIIQATNLAVVVKEDLETIHVWVSNLSNGEMRKGIELTIFDTKNELGKEYTDGSGYCAIKKNSYGIYEKLIILASDSNGDRTYLTSANNELSMWGLANYSNRAADRVISGEIIFDRKLYRPGDEVFFKGILAERYKGELEALVKRKVVVSIKNSSGENVYEKSITTTENGGVWGSWEIPDDAPLGHYSIGVKEQGEKEQSRGVYDTFQVEEFRPVTFTVSIDGAKDSRVGEKLDLVIDGSYLFGAPMGNAPVAWSISRQKKSFSFERYSDFTFGDYSYWIDDSSDTSGTGYYSGGEGKLNGAGKIPLELTPLGMTFSEKVSSPEAEYIIGNAYDMKIEATVKDVDEKSVTRTENISVFTGNFLIGIRTPVSYLSYMDPFSFDLVAVTNDGSKTSGKSCDVRIIKNTWKSIKTKGPEGSLQTRNSLVKEVVYKKTVTLSSDPLSMKYKPSSPGIYTITVQERGGTTSSRTGVYAYGGDFNSWNFNDDDSVSVIPDKSEYKPGETARVLIQSPYKDCRAIITLEREKVIWSKTVILDGKGAPISVPITEEYAPNVYLGVMIVRPRIKGGPELSSEEMKSFKENDLGVPKFKAGFATLNVKSSSRDAKLDIIPDRETYSPGDKIKLKIKTEPGAEIAISVADRGVLDLVNYMFKNPLVNFLSRWPLGVRILHNMDLIIRQFEYAIKGSSPGGGGDDENGEGLGGFSMKNEDGTRRNIKYTAYWNPKIIADNRGNAEVEFLLPDNLTTFRIMAIAAAGGKYSSFNREFKVRKAMVVQKNVPRFIRAGDNLFIGGIVINQTGIEGEFKVSMESDLLKAGSSFQKIVIKPGESREVLFPVSLDNKKYSDIHRDITDAIRSGKKNINKMINVTGYISVEPVAADKFIKAGFKNTEVKDRLQFIFPVKEYSVEEAFTISGFTDSSAKEMIRFPSDKNIFPEFGGLTVNLSSTALVGLNRGFAFYKSNPYFCLEQRASAFLLMMSSGKLLEEFSFRPTDEKGYDFDKIEKIFLGEIKDFRNSDGGFRPWKESSLERSDPYLTAYIVFVLINAEKKGYAVDKSILNSAVLFLQKYLKEPHKDEYSYILESISFINYVSSLAGKGDRSLSKLLLEKKDSLSIRGKGFLALSLAIQRKVEDYKKDSDIKGLMDSFRNSMEITTQKIMFREEVPGAYRRAFYTKGSALATVLTCYMRLDADNPLIPGMVKHIIDSRANSFWGDTHSIAFLSMALDEYREKYEKKGDGKITGKVSINSREIFTNYFPANSISLFTGTKSFDELYAIGKEETDYSLVFNMQGSGRLYYTASMQYFPSAAETLPRDQGLEVRRIIYDLATADENSPFGKEVKTSLKRGEIYLCKLIVVNPKPYYNAIIVDPIPSTVEIINTAFATEKGSLGTYETKQRGVNYWWAYSNPVIEYRDDMVIITENYLSPGMHEYTYLIRPVIKGKAGIPSFNAKLMYEPEIFGRTGKRVIDVK